MSSTDEHIKIITDKIQQLLKRNTYLQKENETLNTELVALKKKEQDYAATIDSVSQKLNILQAVSGNMSETDKKEFEKRINLFVKEIEKCIGILSE